MKYRSLRSYCQLACLSLLILSVQTFAAGQGSMVIREFVINKLSEIQKLYEEDEFAAAQQATTRFIETAKLRDFERVQVLNMQGYIYVAQEQATNAIAAFEQVLTEPRLSPALQESVLLTLAQLYLMEERYPESFERINTLMDIAETTTPEMHVLKAQVLYQLDRPTEALGEINGVIAMATATGKQPREPWLALKNALLFTQEDLPAMRDNLVLLVELYPRDSYLLQLAAVYSRMEEPRKQLAILEPMYEQQRLDQPQHLINLAYLYLNLDAPQKAAQLLQNAIEHSELEANFDHWQLLGRSWQSAKDNDKAVAAYHQAANLSEKGDLWVSIAYIHINRLEWVAAESALNNALAKDSVKDPGNARLLLGMVRFNQQHFDEAREAFRQAVNFDDSRRHARQWLDYVESEVAKRQALES